MDEPRWTARVVEFWPTLLMKRVLPGHDLRNGGLCRYIEAMNAERDQFTTRYQGMDLFAEPGAEVQWLRAGVDDSVQRYFATLDMLYPIRWDLQAWANVNRRGEYHAPHNHGWCYLSGTYYAAMPPAPDNSMAGAISFYDPRVGASMLSVPGDRFSRHELTLRPEPGTLLLWHSAMQHLVHPNLSDDARITVSFNVVLEWANHYAE